MIIALMLCMWASSCGPTSAPSSEKSAASAYENKLVRRPGPTVEDSKVYLVRNGSKHWIVNASWCASHGFKWPDDVHEIPAADLDAIPTADPIQ